MHVTDVTTYTYPASKPAAACLQQADFAVLIARPEGTCLTCHNVVFLPLTGKSTEVQQGKAAVRDGHAPEVVPSEGDAKVSKGKPGRSAMKRSKTRGQSKVASERSQKTSPKASGQVNDDIEHTAGETRRRSASPIFLSPSESLTSNSSRSDSLGQPGRESDSFADAAAAALASTGQRVKPSSSTTTVKDEAASSKLSSAALKSLDGGKGSKASKASSRASVKSHSRSSSVAAEWHDVELQSEAEDEVQHGKTAAGSRQSGPFSAKSHAAEAAARAASDSDNDSELGITEGEQQEQHAGSSFMSAHGKALFASRHVCCICTLLLDAQPPILLAVAG